MERSRFPVPEGEREHSLECLDGAVDAPLGDRRQQHLGVGVSPEPMTERLERPAQFQEVVNLSVVGHNVAPGAGAHRLVALRREVDDRQAAAGQGQSDGGVDPRSRIVWTAVA